MSPAETSFPRVAVFFDAGGTLLSERRGRGRLYAEAFEAQGLSIEADAMENAMRSMFDVLPMEIEGAFRYSDDWFRHYIRALGAELGFEGDIVRVADSLIDVFGQPSTFRVFEDVRPTWDVLSHRGVAIGVLSNWGEKLRHLLDGLGLSESCQAILISAEERQEKPSEAFFLNACQKMGLPPEQCIHIGDREDLDARGASSAGLCGIQIDRERPSNLGAGRIRDLREICDHPLLAP